MQRSRSATVQRLALAVLAAASLVGAQGGAALANSSASTLPANWHVHDGQTALGPQHKGIGFFPRILGISASQYALDPARCPNATDKAFLPSFGHAASSVLRAGICVTSTAVIHLRTVPLGVSGPAGWSWLLGTDGGGYVTYYRVTTH